MRRLTRKFIESSIFTLEAKFLRSRVVYGGDKVSTRVIEAKVACRGVRWPRKTAEKQ